MIVVSFCFCFSSIIFELTIAAWPSPWSLVLQGGKGVRAHSWIFMTRMVICDYDPWLFFPRFPLFQPIHAVSLHHVL